MTEPTQLAEPASSELDPHYRHPLLADLLEVRQSGGTMSRFGAGLKVTFRSAKLLAKTPKLWSVAAVPAAINISLFLLFAGLLLWNHASFLPDAPTGEGFVASLLSAGWWVLRVVLIPLLLFLAYFAAMLLGQVFASPFNDLLSEKVETVLHGQPVASPTGLKAMVTGGIKGGFQAFVLAIGKLVVALPLGFVPVVGPLLTATIAAYFFSVDNTDYAFERRRYGLRLKLKTLLSDKPFTLGFGAGVWAIFAIPLLNFFCLPIAVTGGTAVALAYDEATPAAEGETAEGPAAI
jgi:CysZ protein